VSASGSPPPLAMSFLLLNFPDPALRQPATLASVVPVFLSIYAQAVLAILPNTFILKLSLLPFIVWQAWSCAVRMDVSMGLAKWLGFKNEDSLSFWNMIFVVGAISCSRKQKKGFWWGCSDTWCCRWHYWSWHRSRLNGRSSSKNH
jgi:hypothetical protein